MNPGSNAVKSPPTSIHSAQFESPVTLIGFTNFMMNYLAVKVGFFLSLLVPSVFLQDL